MPRATNKDGRGSSSTIKLYHDDNRERLQTHLMHVLAADSFAPLLNTAAKSGDPGHSGLFYI
jgi:hypothetical protein